MGIIETKEEYIPKGERKREGTGVKNGYYRGKRRIYTKRRERKRTERCWKWVYMNRRFIYTQKCVSKERKRCAKYENTNTCE